MPARSSASNRSRVLHAFLLAVTALLGVAPVFVATPVLAQITAIQPVESIDLEEDEDFPWLLLGIAAGLCVWSKQRANDDSLAGRRD